MITSSPSGFSFRKALRLYGTPITKRRPFKEGCARARVTVPMTLATRMSFQLLNDAGKLAGTSRRFGTANDPCKLLEFVKCSARNFDTHKIGTPKGRRFRRGDRPGCRDRPNPRYLVGDTADH